MNISTTFQAQRSGMRDIFGPLLDLSSAPGDSEFAVIPSIAPAGLVVPLHSHGERETMVIVEGTLTAWLDGSWRTYGPGQIVDVAPNRPHALRNDGLDEVAMVLVTTSRMARFFQEISLPQAEAAMTSERLTHFAETAAKYGFWTASPAEQAAIGIEQP